MTLLTTEEAGFVWDGRDHLMWGHVAQGRRGGAAGGNVNFRPKPREGEKLSQCPDQSLNL